MGIIGAKVALRSRYVIGDDEDAMRLASRCVSVFFARKRAFEGWAELFAFRAVLSKNN